MVYRAPMNDRQVKIGIALIRYPAWKDSSFRCTPGDYWRITPIRK
jgi:hypothetical protein